MSALTINTPNFSATKTAITGPILPDGTFNATYNIAVENNGAVTLNSLIMVDNVVTSLGSNFVSLVTPPSIINTVDADPASVPTTVFPAASPTYTGLGDLLDPASPVSLEPGDTFDVIYVVNVRPNNGGGLTNTVEPVATALGFGAFEIFQTDGTGERYAADDSAELFPIVVPSISLEKSISLIDDTNGNGFTDPGDTCLLYTSPSPRDRG